MREQSIHRSFLQGALILSIAGIIAKVMGALYRIPFQNIVGDIGYYVYQQVYPFYGIYFALAMYGFPVVISKMVAESKRGTSKQTENDTVVISSIVLGILFTAIFAIIYFGAPFIALIMRDPMLVPAIKAASFSFLLLPVISVLRGINQGYENMLPTGVSQVIEQLTRVFFILVVSFVIVGRHGTVYEIGAWSALGGVVGGLFSFLTLLFFLLYHKIEINLHHHLDFKKVIHVTKQLLVDGFAISIAASIMILFQFIDAFEIPYVLTNTNLSSDMVKVQKGVFDRGQPLLQLGIVIATSISLSLVPYISQAFSNRDWKSIAESAATSLKIGLVLGGAAAAGLAIIIGPTNIMLFENQDGSAVLGVLGISILFATIALIVAAILQGMGKSLVVTRNVLIGAFTKIILNFFLLQYIGIMGAAIGTVLGVAVIALLNLFVLFKLVPGLTRQRFYGVKIILALLVMSIITFGWKESLVFLMPTYEENRLLAAFIGLSSAIIGVFTYLICLIKWPIWEESEVSYLPSFIDKIVKIKKRRR